MGDRAAEQLVARLGMARDEGFVGREPELRIVADAVAGRNDARVIFVHGPGGIGKSTLLQTMARRAARAGHPARYLDARDVECSAPAVRRVVLAADDDPRTLLLVDGFELLTPLHRWLRTELLPARPAQAVTVVAGRDTPDADWRLDPGWRRLVRVLPLGPLDDRESRRLLADLGVGDQADRLAQLGRGYPLALAMLAEVARSGRRPSELSDEPDAVRRLCAMIVDDVPDEAHRTGLATCAHATRTTEELLAHALADLPGDVSAVEVWRWLESRPYVGRGTAGLFVHDVVRELFETELQQRAPIAYARLHRTVRSFFLQRVSDPAESDPDRAAAEILLLHRRTPLAAETSVLRDRGRLSVPRASVADRDEIVSLVASSDGQWSADLARRWLTAQPRGAYHARSESGTAAFAVQIYLPGPADLMTDDPIAAAIWQLVAERGPLRPGERINVNRFGGASGAYQGDPLQLLVNGTSCILEWCTVPAAWTFVPAAAGNRYGEYFDYLGFDRMLQLDLDGQLIMLHGWDRRRFPVAAFFEMMATRELTGEVGPPPDELLRPVPLSRQEFEAAVRTDLRRLTRRGGLDGSPLLTTALVGAAGGGADPRDALAEVLHRAIAELSQERGGSEHRRVLERTYLSGVSSQEGAAEVLDLPFSTYRRHLTRATDRLVEVLWSLELEGAALAEQQVSNE